MELKEHHLTALRFLRDHPGDEIGVVDSEAKLAAAIVYTQLINAGFIVGNLTPGGGGCRLAPKGALAIIDCGAAQ
jgi:hypothetical protein